MHVTFTFNAYLLLTLKLDLLFCSKLDEYGITSTFEGRKGMLMDRKDGVTFWDILKEDGLLLFVAVIVLPRRKNNISFMGPNI